MVTLCYHKKEYRHFPESYNELSGKQLIGIAALFAADLPEDVAKFRALRILLNRSRLSFGMIPTDAKTRMQERIDWIFDKNKLTNQVLPFYRGFRGPKKEFENLTLAEFHFAELYYREMVVEKNDHSLDKLIAVLYRREKLSYNYELDSDGDARKIFNANEIEYYSRQVSSWPVAAKLAVIIFYDGCRQHLLDLYDEIFKGDSGADNEDGMFGIIRGLCGEKYGDIDKVEAMNIHTALYELTLQLNEAEEIKANTPTVN